MGAAASIVAVTAEDVGEYVYNIGVKYQPYREAIVENGIDGHMISCVNEQELAEILEGLEITNKIHVKKLCTELRRLSNASALTLQHSSSNCSTPTTAVGFVDYETVAFRDHLVTVPSALMSQLFKIQGTPCDPTDLAPTVAVLARIIKQCISDSEAAGIPPKEYDCFLSYRVKADHHTAELLYGKLRDREIGLNPFLDKQCLKTGEDWKVGFLRGLKSSSVFVALVSSDALAPVRDFEKDHTFDSVLLEYQMALEINDARKRAGKPEYIVPVLVAKEESDGRIKKFRDFDPSLYSDSITAQESPEEAERKHLALLEAEEQEHLRQQEENNRRAKVDAERLEKLRREEENHRRALVEAERLEKLKLEEELSRRVKIEVERLEKLKQEAQQLEPKLPSLEENKDAKGIVKVLSYGTAEGKTKAAIAVMRISANGSDTDDIVIANEGGIAPLIQLLRDGTAEGKTKAAGALMNIAVNDENTVRIANEGGIAPLIQLLRDGTAEGKTQAAGALMNIAVNAENQVRIANEGGIAPLIQLLRDGTAEGKTKAAGALCNIASNNAENRVCIANEGGIAPLIQLLRDGTTEGKTNAAGALWSIANNNAENRVRIANEGGIAPLIQLLRDGTAEGKTYAAGALRNMSLSVKDKVRAAGLSDIQAAHDKETDAAAKAKMLDLLNNLK